MCTAHLTDCCVLISFLCRFVQVGWGGGGGGGGGAHATWQLKRSGGNC